MWYGLILFIGLIMLSKVRNEFYESLNFLKKGDRVPATVVKLESHDGEDSVVYRPVFGYTYGDEERIFVYNVSSTPPSWRIGEKATIIVLPADPYKVRLLTYFGVFSRTIHLVGNGLLLIGIALPQMVFGGHYASPNSFLIAFVLPLIVIGGGYYWCHRKRIFLDK
jgi:hypothetical protein